MDTVSQLLDGVSVDGSVFCHGEVRAPWSLSGGAEGLALFHAVLEGQAIAHLPDGDAVALGPGDLVVLPRGRPHVVASDPDLPPVPLSDAVRRDGEQFARLVSDGDGAACRLICGTFRIPELDRHPLLSELPDVLVVSGRDVRWLGETLIQLDHQLEADWPGAQAVTRRLVEILFVQAIARWLETASLAEGRVAAFADPQLGRALAALHAQPGASWSVEGLARQAAMSRSSFYRRFTEVLGEPPAAYLKRWRMVLAQRWLAEGDSGIEEIGLALGYSGSPAFSRAFKEHTGVSPRAYRAEV